MARDEQPDTVDTARSTLLTRPRIVATALALWDADRAGPVSLRRLASELGVGTMTLYTYFDSKDDLLDAMVDQVMGGVTFDPAAGKDLNSAVRAIGHGLLDMMRDHPSVVRQLSTRNTLLRNSLRGVMEPALELLYAAGCRLEGSVRAYGMVMAYTLGFVSYQHPRQWGRQREQASGKEWRRQTDFYSALPSTDFPRIVASADVLPSIASDEQFDFGLDLIALGLAAAIESEGT